MAKGIRVQDFRLGNLGPLVVFGLLKRGLVHGFDVVDVELAGRDREVDCHGSEDLLDFPGFIYPRIYRSLQEVDNVPVTGVLGGKGVDVPVQLPATQSLRDDDLAHAT